MEAFYLRSHTHRSSVSTRDIFSSPLASNSHPSLLPDSTWDVIMRFVDIHTDFAPFLLLKLCDRAYCAFSRNRCDFNFITSFSPLARVSHPDIGSMGCCSRLFSLVIVPISHASSFIVVECACFDTIFDRFLQNLYLILLFF